MTDNDLAFASIEEVARLYRKRKLSPVEVTKLMLTRIDQLNPKLNAYITVTAELAIAQAKKPKPNSSLRAAAKVTATAAPSTASPSR